MSAGYAERLAEYPDKGVCGLPETCDSRRAFTSKLVKLSQLLQQSKYTVVLTGAGISTSAGIPDFRGPSGVWTREQQERKRRKKSKGGSSIAEKETNKDGGNLPLHEQSNTKPSSASGRKRKQTELPDTEDKPKFTSFENALPTYTHTALTHLILHPPPENSEENNNENITKRTYLHHIVTQNVDGLHRKTNIPREKMSILHGDIFTEICDTCHTEHVCKHEIQSIGLKHTGHNCTLGGSPAGSCPGKLKDTLLDWEDDLPQIDWARAQEECYKADLVLCLGTSLRIEPAGGLCTYPTYPTAAASSGGKKKGGKKKKKASEKLGYAIVNLQRTPYDEGAALVVRGRVDDVMKGLMEKLGYGCDWDASDEAFG
mmetsp:Transcript_37160/g.68289  ORF Transcript_37160/g.68289 Transcript_37160/m.68289 type:complete len:372 (-) Transcript_37160:206-1321(-)